MHNLRRFYYSNKSKIWKVIAIIAFAFVIIQILNNVVKKQNEEKLNNLTNNTINKNNVLIDENKDTQLTTDKSVVTGQKISSDKLKKDTSLIEQFISNCNNGNIEQAYSLLSSECKKEQFSNIEQFKKLYYSKVFDSNIKKIATIENWFSDTYKISITEDILATGKISETKKQDYMTVIKENEELKLNINSFVGIENINIKRNIQNITFNVVSKNVYMDYEEYIIQVENGTEGTILLDTQTDTKSIYLKDINNIKYYVYSHELLSGLLRINKGFSNQIKIKFSKPYSSSGNKINSIVFSDVILNYNKDKNKQIINIEI